MAATLFSGVPSAWRGGAAAHTVGRQGVRRSAVLRGAGGAVRTVPTWGCGPGLIGEPRRGNRPAPGVSQRRAPGGRGEGPARACRPSWIKPQSAPRQPRTARRAAGAGADVADDADPPAMYSGATAIIGPSKACRGLPRPAAEPRRHAAGRTRSAHMPHPIPRRARRPARRAQCGNACATPSPSLPFAVNIFHIVTPARAAAVQQHARPASFAIKTLRSAEAALCSTHTVRTHCKHALRTIQLSPAQAVRKGAASQ